MAHRTTLIDDLDGHPIAPGRGGTITFSLGDDLYEIDLGFANAARLHRILAPYIDAGRLTALEHHRTSGHRITGTRAGTGSTRRGTLTAVRHWAIYHGYDVPRSGRISADVQAAYDTAH